MNTSDFFLETQLSLSDKILLKIKKGEWTDIMNGLCKINDRFIILDNNYFKYFASKETYGIILTQIVYNIDVILSNYGDFNVHINMKGLTVSDIDKHLSFIQSFSTLLKEKYPNE